VPIRKPLGCTLMMTLLAFAGCDQPLVSPKPFVLQASESNLADWNRVGERIALSMQRVGYLPSDFNGHPHRQLWPQGAWRVVVATPSDGADLDRGGRFGDAVAGMVRSRLSQHGLAVSEVRLRRAMRLAPDGETMLSRQIAALGPAPAVDAVVTGSYVAGNQMIYVTLELVGRTNGAILASSDFAVPRFPDLDPMLR
jgi:hypothetical protein